MVLLCLVHVLLYTEYFQSNTTLYSVKILTILTPVTLGIDVFNSNQKKKKRNKANVCIVDSLPFEFHGSSGAVSVQINHLETNF